MWQTTEGPAPKRTLIVLMVLGACIPGTMAGLILGPVGVDHILRALRWIEGGPGDPSFLLGALLIAAAITPFAIGVAAGAYARRRGRPWEQAVKTGAVTAFLTGVVAFIAAMPIAVVFA